MLAPAHRRDAVLTRHLGDAVGQCAHAHPTRRDLTMRGPKNPGAVVVTLSFACLVAALGWNDRHDLTDTTRKGYPVWFLLVVLSVLCVVGLVHAWRKGPGDRP